MVCNFSVQHYRELLMSAKDAYRFIKLIEAKNLPDDMFILMRHDVDFSLNSALRMAQIEAECGINTTYCICLRSPFYSIHNDYEFGIISTILKMGHDIGLHYDPNFYQNRGLSANQGIKDEIQILEREFGTKIIGISQHAPASNDVFQPEKEYVDAYDKRLTTDIKYISDSGQSWRNGCLCKHLFKFDKIHVLIHPEWWMFNGAAWEKVLRSIKVESVSFLSHQFDIIIDWTRGYLEKRNVLDIEYKSKYHGSSE